jgi:hypothetical protein
MQLMNFVMSVLLYKESARVSRLGTSLRLGIAEDLLLPLGATLPSGMSNSTPESEIRRLQ